MHEFVSFSALSLGLVNSHHRSFVVAVVVVVARCDRHMERIPVHPSALLFSGRSFGSLGCC
jgi:hypothetical protein